MFGLSLIGIILFVVFVVILLIIEVAFWVIVISVLGALALLLWTTGLHEAAISVALAVGIIWAVGWGIYRLIKWDLGRLGAPPKANERSLAWRLHDLMNAPFSLRLHPKAKNEVPPSDPRERFLWANRLGNYSDEGERSDGIDSKADR